MFLSFVVRRLVSRLTGGKVSKPGKVQAPLRLPSLLRLGYALIRDERIPMWQRASVVSLLAFIFSPFDVIGDIPIIGQFWDFTLAVVVLDAFIAMSPATVVDEHIIRLGVQDKVPLRGI